MRLFWISVLTILTISCKQEVEHQQYLPFHKTQQLREMGNTDDLLQKLYTDYHSNPSTQAQKDQNLIIDYLTEHKILADRTDSGVYYKVYKYGTGAQYVRSQQFSAKYTGYFLDGRVFDSNVDSKDPLIKRVGEMIVGWNDALIYLSPQTKVTLFVPSKLAYGESGVKKVIPPNKVLAFDIELLP